MFSPYDSLACQAISPYPDTSPTSSPPQNVRVPSVPLNMWEWTNIYPSEPPFPLL